MPTNKDPKQDGLSVLLDLLSHLILIHNLLEVPEPLGRVVEDVLLLYALTHDLVEDYLETYRYAAALQVGIVVFPDFLYFRVFLAHALAHALALRLIPRGLLHKVSFKIIFSSKQAGNFNRF